MNANTRLIGESVFRTNLHKSAKVSWFNPLAVICVLGVAFLFSRAFFLQVVMGTNHALLADGNSIDVKSVPAERGVITDRNGEVLARNGLGKDGKLIRDYPQAENTSHVVGYLGLVSADDLTNCQQKNKNCVLTGEDLIGKLGIERMMDTTLRGKPGEDVLEVDARRKVVRTLEHTDSEPGPSIKLNIDDGLQRFINEKLAQREADKGAFNGSVIVTQTSTGKVLGLVSWPSFDPNESLTKVLADTKRNPMFTRPISGAYPPGSVFKLVTSVAGLESGAIDHNTLLEDTGVLKVGTYTYGNWLFEEHGRTEGFIDVTKAIGRSNDIFFYQVGEKMGVNTLHDWAVKLGLGTKSGIDLVGEVTGRVPEPIWKERTTGERWFLGNTYHMSIGQGDLQVTPLQINRMTSAVISGKLCDPRLVGQGDCHDLGLKDSTKQTLLDGMIEACQPGGTAFPFFGFAPQVACKTGTAQTGSEKTKPHSWITVIVPSISTNDLANGKTPSMESYQKGITITIMLEESGEGSYEAGPIAKDIAQYLVDHKF